MLAEIMPKLGTTISGLLGAGAVAAGTPDAIVAPESPIGWSAIGLGAIALISAGISSWNQYQEKKREAKEKHDRAYAIEEADAKKLIIKSLQEQIVFLKQENERVSKDIEETRKRSHELNDKANAFLLKKEEENRVLTEEVGKLKTKIASLQA